jgi:hypothetical protein
VSEVVAKETEGTKNQQLLDRIELRRFVGRELLLWIWFESELFEGTLWTKKHGSFGLWLEGRLVIDAGKESTVIKGTAPGQHREAKEALLRGKTPSRAGLHVSIGDREISVTLRGEMLALAALSPPGKPEKEEKADAPALAAPPVRKKKASGPKTIEEDDTHEAFYERMRHAHDVEELFTALYKDFLSLRLCPTWDSHVLPALETWARGDAIDERAYQSARTRIIGKRN